MKKERRVKENHPVCQVQWVKREKLTANNYNPNFVAPQEMDLLRTSLLEDGWTQPIVVTPEYTIVDGFHRWTLAGEDEVAKMTGGEVPVVMIAADPAHTKMSTVRHNRARGVHAVLKMSDIVCDLLKQGLKEEEICARMGMEREEVIRLGDQAGIPTKVVRDGSIEFEKGWGVGKK